MRLTPGQVAELRGERNVRGTVHVDRDQLVLFLVAISYAAFERLQVLAHARSLSPGLVWYVHEANPNRVELHTTHPEWFVELEDMIDAARRSSLNPR